ncbi:MAG: MATE family efflux transporter [Spirochaetales bacterium]|nr:MATE family efflux transporter [Spirochaetales bacterium]
MDKEHAPTKGVKTLLGDPKKAIFKLAVPMIIAMSVQTLYSLADAFWVAGISSDALAAVGYFFPFYMFAIALSTGLGVGGGSAISRRIGKKDKEGANAAATHTLAIMMILSFVYMIPLFFSISYIFSLLGAGNALGMAVDYAHILILGTIPIFFSQIGNALLRSEGNATKAMIAITSGAVLNIALDPVFIFWFGLGVAGAAWATLISLCLSSLMLAFWLFRDEGTYITIRFSGFRFRSDILADIFKVGIPATISQASMSIMMFAITFIVRQVGENEGVAVYTTGWRVVSLAILPLLGLATAVISVSGATYGAREYRKLNTAYLHAIKMGIIIEIGVALFTVLFAPLITMAFTWSPETRHIAPDLTLMLRIIWIFYPFVVFGMFSSSMFQGTGKGIYALIITIGRTIVLNVAFVYLFGMVFKLGLVGVWIGMIAATFISSAIAFVWARIYINGLLNTSPSPPAEPQKEEPPQTGVHQIKEDRAVSTG